MAMQTVISPTVAAKLCVELRVLRELRGWTGDSVAKRLRWSPSKLSRYERGKTGLQVAEVIKLLDLYRVEGEQRAELLALAKDADGKGWWRAYGMTEAEMRAVRCEDEAVFVGMWDSAVVPPLLQTDDYAAALARHRTDLERMPPGRVQKTITVARLRRSAVLDRSGVSISAVIAESVLRRPVGGDRVMAAQAAHLAELAARPGVAIRILPDTAVLLPQARPFTLFEFEVAPPVVVLEHLNVPAFFDGDRETYLTRVVLDAMADMAWLPGTLLPGGRPAATLAAGLNGEASG